MALTALEQNTISRGLNAAKLVVETLKPTLDSLNIIYDSGGGAKQTIDQAGLDATASFSHLTKAQLDDGMYALTAVLKGAIDGAYTALAQLSARS